MIVINAIPKKIKCIGRIIVLLVVTATPAFAVDWGSPFDWTSSNIQLLYGNDFELGDDERATMTVEHSNGWKYGSNFFFVDIINRNDLDDVEIYAEVYSYLSLNKISGKDFSLGPINDFSLVAGLNIDNFPDGEPFRAYLLGVSVDLNNEAFDYLQVDITTFKNEDLSGRYGIQITPVWSVPFVLGDLSFKFRGFIDFRNANTNASHNVNMLAQPQVLLDIGDLIVGKQDKLYLGTEYSYWYNKFGIKGVEESVVQGMLILFF